MRICIFCGSRPGSHQQFTDDARIVGEELARRGHVLIYGGADSGLMGTVADAVLAAGGTAEGVMPRVLADLETAHAGLNDLHQTEGMHERKARMHELSDAYLVLPGGYGTLEELAEVLSWRQIGLLQKPIAFLNTRGIFDQLIALLRTMARFGFLSEESIEELIVEAAVPPLFDRLEAAR